MSADPTFYAGFVTPGAAHCFPGGCMTAPTVRGRFAMNHGYAQGRQLLATDPLGTTTLTLTNVVAGSRYRIERQGDGSLAEPTANAEGVAASSTVAITLNYYSAGNSNNDLKVKVRKGTDAPTYKPFETQTTVGAASQSIYVGQIADE